MHTPGSREGLPLLGGSIARRPEQPLSSRGLWRHPRAHVRTKVSRWRARAAWRREATHPSLSVAAATLQPVRPASNFGLSCPLGESRPTTLPRHRLAQSGQEAGCTQSGRAWSLLGSWGRAAEVRHRRVHSLPPGPSGLRTCAESCPPSVAAPRPAGDATAMQHRERARSRRYFRVRDAQA